MKLISKFQKGKKFSNTPTGRAMQRQYDLEHGITTQKVLPEVEVFPNRYDLDNNGYSNSFAIPLGQRPTTFSQGEISQPYIPKKLEEQGWLNRTFGINNFGLGIRELIGNPANIVPTGQTIQGIKAITSVGSKTKNTGQTISKAKRAYRTPTADIMPVEGSISTNDIPNITSGNASSITPEQWTAAQDAAIAKGDMTEAQRLRDLHFKAAAPNSVTYDVFHHGNTKPMNWFTFDPARVGTTDEGFSGAGYYFAPTRPASQYSKEHFAHALGPHLEENAGLSGGRYHRYVYLNGETKYKPIREYDWTTHTDFPFVDNRPIEVVVGDNRQIKLADAVTYDNNGIRIPLGSRDNFSNPDIRYGLLPFILGGTGYNYLNQNK